MALILRHVLRRCTPNFRPILSSNSRKTYCTEVVCGSSTRRGLILGVHQGESGEFILTPSALKFNDHVGGKVKDLLKCYKPMFRKGQSHTFNNVDPGFWAIALASIGPQNMGVNEMEDFDEDRENVRVAAAGAARLLRQQGCTVICVDGMGYPEQAAEGSTLALYRYQEHKNKEQWKMVPQLELFDSPDQDSWQKGLFKAESQNLVRTLCETPANLMTPLHFAQHTVNELCPCGIKVEVHDKDWIEAKKMNAFLTVARGSCAPPLFIEINYCGAGSSDRPILLVGKGVTYDSGGMCLSHEDLHEMNKAEMAGAAVVVAAIRAASAFSLPINITGLLPLCENLPSGMAMKVGDIIMGMNGKSIKVDDTDNEGRLCLCDALVYGQQVYKPRLIIDISTESDGIKSALGSAATGVYCNSHTIWKEVLTAGCVTGDRCWRMPLWKYFIRNVTRTQNVDVCNKGIGMGDPCLAAAFIQEFISCVDWVHFDINGTGMKAFDEAYPYLRRGQMTGRPTRTIIQLLYQLACPPDQAAGAKC